MGYDQKERVATHELQRLNFKCEIHLYRLTFELMQLKKPSRTQLN